MQNDSFCQISFGDNLKCRMKYLENKWNFYEIENNDNENICTITVNPKKYFEKLKKIEIN